MPGRIQALIQANGGYIDSNAEISLACIQNGVRMEPGMEPGMEFMESTRIVYYALPNCFINMRIHPCVQPEF